MKKTGKKHRQAKEIVRAKEAKSIDEVFAVIIDTAHAKFDESVDASIELGIDPSKGEQTVRGSVLLPHGTGKKVKVLVFAKGEYEDQAKEAGADFVGLDDLIEKIGKGWLGFDAAVAIPDVMGKVGKVAKILGPRGLLPNKKVGTVTFDVKQIVTDLKKGRVSFRNDKSGIINVLFGRLSFGSKKLKENFTELMKAILANKPPTAKGKFVRRVMLSSTMGVGMSVSPESVV